MARLHDLRTLVERARQSRAAAAPPHDRKKAGPSAPQRATKPPHPAPHGARPSPGSHDDTGTQRPFADPRGDIDLAAEFVDVTPLAAPAARVHSRRAPIPVARQHLADERDALERSKWGAEPSPSTWDIGQEIEGSQTHLRAGLGVDILTRLRRGHWSVQGELDLHGLTVDEAHDLLFDFILGARTRGVRCVRVIHGKGLSSRNREPVLKGKVRRWLTQWDEVLAYCEAPRHAGGSGAVLVLLRARG